MIWSIITFGGIVFWCLFALFALLVTYIVNKEDSSFSPLFWSGVAVGLTFAFTDVPIPDITLVNAIIGFVGWFVIGTAWAFGKWIHLSFQIRNFVREYTGEADELGKAACRAFQPCERSYELTLPPQASDFRTRMTTWIVYWPASMVATVIGDLIAPAAELFVDLGGRIAKALSGSFTAVSKRIYES